MHLKLLKTITKTKSGFTLIELSMVLVIVGILFSYGLIAYQSILFNSRTKTTKDRIDRVYKAIGNYLVINRKLPCPARLDLTNTDTNYGISRTCISESGVTLSSSPNNNLAYGMVPTKTLGLPSNMAEDAFGTKFSYIIDTRFSTAVTSTGTTGFEGADPNATNMMTIKELSASGSNIITDGIMLILSHGPNKLKGFNSAGTAQNNNTNITADETENVIESGSFDNIFVTNSSNTAFDDILLFKNKMQLVVDAGFENMMCREADSNYLVETPNANNTYNTNKCYDDNTITISLTWASANYGENKIPKNNDPCPVACPYNSNPTDYDNNATTNHPLRRCGKYGKWDKVVYLCSKTGGGGGTIINNVGVYTRLIANSPTAADSSTWWSNNGASWTLAQKTAVSNFQQISVGLTTNDALGTGANTDTIMIDLGLTKSCTKLYYRSTGSSTPGGWGANSYSTGLKLSYWNGSSWIDLLTFPTFSADYDVYEPTFTSTSARYWRLLKGSGGWPSATRFQMFCN